MRTWATQSAPSINKAPYVKKVRLRLRKCEENANKRENWISRFFLLFVKWKINERMKIESQISISSSFIALFFSSTFTFNFCLLFTRLWLCVSSPSLSFSFGNLNSNFAKGSLLIFKLIDGKLWWFCLHIWQMESKREHKLITFH